MKTTHRQSCLAGGLLLLGLVTCGFAAEQAGHTPEPGQQREERTMSQISEAVLAQDLTAAALAKKQGAAAIPELVQLLQHEENGVRTVAVIALGEIDHPEAIIALMGAAEEEEDGMVAGTAVAKLERHAGRIGAARLIELLGRMKNSAAQGQLVLVIGQLASGKDTSILQGFCTGRIDSDTVPACLAALARLGDEQARKDFANYLTTARNLRAFTLTEYIGQRWLLPFLGVLLRDQSPVQSLGDPPPGFPAMLRVCDKAVVLIARISDEKMIISLTTSPVVGSLI